MRTHTMLLVIGVVVVACQTVSGNGNEVSVSLDMPRYAHRGSSVALTCQHNVVARDLVYRVEWRRSGGKLFQYIRGRTPSPYRDYPTQGAHINMTLSNESKIVLQNVQFSASGSYSCEISLETPIFTKSSSEKELLVIQPQRHAPHVIFNSEEYTMSDILEATCTSSPAHPAPHITWFINGEKVDIVYVSSVLITQRPLYLRTSSTTTVQTLATALFTTTPTSTTTRICSSSHLNKTYTSTSRLQKQQRQYRLSKMDESLTVTKTVVARHNRPDALHASTTRLRVPVADLRLEYDSRKMQVTCLSTIPAYRGPSGRYADSKNKTIYVSVTIAEELEQTTSTETYQNGCLHIKSFLYVYIMLLWCPKYFFFYRIV